MISISDSITIALCVGLALLPAACAGRARRLGDLDDLAREYRRGAGTFGIVAVLAGISLQLSKANGAGASFALFLLVNILASLLIAWWFGARGGCYLLAFGVLLWSKQREKLVVEWRKWMDPLQTAVWKRYTFALVLGLIWSSKYVIIGGWVMNAERELQAQLSRPLPPAARSTR